MTRDDLEVWVSVVGYDNLYQVSDLGRLAKSGRILSQYQNPISGYMTAHLIRKTVNVHVIVAAAFLGNRPHGFDVNHIDGNKTNNRRINIEYVSRSQNMVHAHKLRLPNSSVLTPDQVTQIRELRPTHSLRQLAVIFGVSRGTITFVTTGKTWRWV